MEKDNIIQFVGFITNLDPEVFSAKWEEYANTLDDDHSTVRLVHNNSSRGKFRYVSRHNKTGQAFRFAFMKEKHSENFPEQKVKVVQAGGYTAIQVQCKNQSRKDSAVIVFLSHDENDLSFYTKLPISGLLNIYKAYYESSTYGHILEYFVPPSDVEVLLEQLKDRHGAEAAYYTKCIGQHA
jgi:hypothetical protein